MDVSKDRQPDVKFAGHPYFHVPRSALAAALCQISEYVRVAFPKMATFTVQPRKRMNRQIIKGDVLPTLSLQSPSEKNFWVKKVRCRIFM